MSEQTVNEKETQVTEATAEATAETSEKREERRNDRGDRRGNRGERGDRRGNRGREEEKDKFIERVVTINRVSKVVKGGRRFSFTALVVVGDGNGMVGVGYGKAKEVPAAISKGVEEAKKNFFRVPRIEGRTIPHRVQGEAAAGVVMLRPATAGTGVIAGGPVRAVLEAAGIHVRWSMGELPERPWLDPPMALHVLRIVQETLANVLKHARANEVAISAQTDEGSRSVIVRVADNGIGFTPRPDRLGRGLKNMKHRARQLGGSVSITPDEQQGTRMELRLPVER